MEFRTVKVHMSGNAYYPSVIIARDGDSRWMNSVRNYAMNESRMKWLDALFASHRGNIYVDFENSTVSLVKPKGKP